MAVCTSVCRTPIGICDAGAFASTETRKIVVPSMVIGAVRYGPSSFTPGSVGAADVATDGSVSCASTGAASAAAGINAKRHAARHARRVATDLRLASPL